MSAVNPSTSIGGTDSGKSDRRAPGAPSGDRHLVNREVDFSRIHLLPVVRNLAKYPSFLRFTNGVLLEGTLHLDHGRRMPRDPIS